MSTPAESNLFSAITAFLEFVRQPIDSVEQILSEEIRSEIPPIDNLLREVHKHRSDGTILDATMTALLPGLAVHDFVQRSRTALLIGTLVEWGGNPALVIDETLSRLETQLFAAQGFVELLANRFSLDEPVQATQAQLAQAASHDLDGFQAWHGLEMIGLSTMTMLVRHVESRKRARDRHRLLHGLSNLEGSHDTIWYVWELLSTDDDVEILVLNLERTKGYVVRLEAVRNNFHLFTLLQCLLPDQPPPQASSPLPQICALAQGELVPGELPQNFDTGRWSYHPWFALQPDSTFNDMWFIGGEHKSSQIPDFEGRRIVLLKNPPTMSRQWDVNFFAPLHEALRTGVHIQQILSPDEVIDWLKRITAQTDREPRFRGNGGCAICGPWEA